jgi:hypothetical protein
VIRLIYLAHPLSGAVVENLAKAKAWIRWCYDHHRDVAILAPWILDVECTGEDDADDLVRESALVRCEAVVGVCSEVWLVGGRVSPGMRREVAAAMRAGLHVRDLTSLGATPPAAYDGSLTSKPAN